MFLILSFGIKFNLCLRLHNVLQTTKGIAAVKKVFNENSPVLATKTAQYRSGALKWIEDISIYIYLIWNVRFEKFDFENNRI